MSYSPTSAYYFACRITLGWGGTFDHMEEKDYVFRRLICFVVLLAPIETMEEPAEGVSIDELIFHRSAVIGAEANFTFIHEPP